MWNLLRVEHRRAKNQKKVQIITPSYIGLIMEMTPCYWNIICIFITDDTINMNVHYCITIV